MIKSEEEYQSKRVLAEAEMERNLANIKDGEAKDLFRLLFEYQDRLKKKGPDETLRESFVRAYMGLMTTVNCLFMMDMFDAIIIRESMPMAKELQEALHNFKKELEVIENKYGLR